MLGASIAFQFLKMQRLQVVEDPFVWSRPDHLHNPPVSNAFAASQGHSSRVAVNRESGPASPRAESLPVRLARNLVGDFLEGEVE
jgi:hypothetical protein